MHQVRFTNTNDRVTTERCNVVLEELLNGVGTNVNVGVDATATTKTNGSGGGVENNGDDDKPVETTGVGDETKPMSLLLARPTTTTAKASTSEFVGSAKAAAATPGPPDGFAGYQRFRQQRWQ
uniref:Uncharacterized protein n=1 Tax=Pseudo-nitzschia australis TaxID=44445 RepID=A0A7S4AF22_9STRA